MKESPRSEFLYWNDDGELVAVHVCDWKIVFKEQDNKGIGVWQGEFTRLRAPILYNLRSDPFEKGTNSIEYGDWMTHRTFMLVPAQAIIAKWLESFREFPPRAKAASFTVSDAMEKIQAVGQDQN